MRNLVALGAGLLFGLGLTVSSMIEPAKVLAFLDVAGAWDPSLLFVMAAAVPLSAAAFAIARRHAHPFAATAFQMPATRSLDRRLAIGAILFGAGWGLAGFCPGPALAALGFGARSTWIFVLAMLVGMALYELMPQRRAPR